MIMSLCLHSYTNAPVLYHRSHFTSFFVLQQFEFTKTPPPTSNYKEEKIEFSKKLLKYYITLAQYESTLVLLRVKLSRKFTCTCNNIGGAFYVSTHIPRKHTSIQGGQAATCTCTCTARRLCSYVHILTKISTKLLWQEQNNNVMALCLCPPQNDWN